MEVISQFHASAALLHRNRKPCGSQSKEKYHNTSRQSNRDFSVVQPVAWTLYVPTELSNPQDAAYSFSVVCYVRRCLKISVKLGVKASHQFCRKKVWPFVLHIQVIFTCRLKREGRK